MDAKDSTVRRYLAQRAELLGAIRLPNDAFKKNAGAEVVSDIILSLIHILLPFHAQRAVSISS